MSKIKAPTLLAETRDGFEQFVKQFDRFMRISKTEENEKLDLLLLVIGSKLSSFYDEIT